MIIWLMQATTQVGSTSNETYIQVRSLKLQSYVAKNSERNCIKWCSNSGKQTHKMTALHRRLWEAHRAGSLFNGTECLRDRLGGTQAQPIELAECCDRFVPQQCPGPEQLVSSQAIQKVYGCTFFLRLIACDSRRGPGAPGSDTKPAPGGGGTTFVAVLSLFCGCCVAHCRSLSLVVLDRGCAAGLSGCVANGIGCNSRFGSETCGAVRFEVHF